MAVEIDESNSNNPSRASRQVLGILMLGTFIGFLNQTLMNTALPSIMADFHITAALGQWLTNGYMLVNGVMVPLTAFLIQRFTTRQLYLSALTIFGIGTLIAGLAPNYPVLITGRMIQAMGGGIFGPLMNVVIMKLFSVEHRGRAMGIIGLALNFAPTLGPTVSGWIVTYTNWRNLFFMVAPLIFLDLIFAFFKLRNIGEQKFLKFDFLGVVLSSLGLGSLLVGFSNAGTGDWGAFAVWGYILIGMIITMAFVYQQTHAKLRLVNFNVLKYRQFNVAIIINVVLMIALYGGAILLPLYMQVVMGRSAFESGLVLLPGSLITALLSPISGTLYDKYGARNLTLVGLLINAVGTIMLGLLNMDSSILYIMLWQVIRQVGLVIVTMPIQTEAFSALPIQMVADGSAMFTTIRQLAASFGTAALITIMSLVAQQAAHGGVVAPAHQLVGIQVTYFVATILVLIAAGLTRLLKADGHYRPADDRVM
ncbi:MDR family MFS transporter [Periweissella fabalis]|uniref:Multidrug efflux MFS transporter n=1 Tax=Periweissella fabalis TaxID=1070421 RepID=A0A7X6N122_9LACO|nr:MDR family MFS transporter [Periweissella fabalis]MCM0599528.1 multidrug efflux MFS transporter [Periweissella fabalis]NKZ23833.1 multidrug efflux MFS transporter [Periweissella fabalis]